MGPRSGASVYASAGLASVGASAYAPVVRIGAMGGLAALVANAWNAGVQVGTSFDAGITYISDHPWPTGMGWTAGAIADVSANIRALLLSAGNGIDAEHRRRHLPAAGALYPTNGVDITDTAYLTFEGGGTVVPYGHTGGAEIQTQGSTSPALTHTTSSFWSRKLSGAAAVDPRFHCLTVSGTGVPGSTVASVTAGNGGEVQDGWAAMGWDGFWIDHCISDRNKGDGIYIVDGANGLASAFPTRNGLITDSTIKRNGRMGIAPVWGRDIAAYRVRGEDICYAMVDVEPDHSFQVNHNLHFEAFSLGDYGWDPDFIGTPMQITRPSDASGTFSMTGYRRMVDWDISGNPKTLAQDWYHTYLEAPWAQFDKPGTATVTGNRRTGAAVARPGPAVRFYSAGGGALYANNALRVASGAFMASSGVNGTLTNGGGNS